MRYLLAAVAAALLSANIGCQTMRGCGAGCGACPAPTCGCESCECGPSCGCDEPCGCGDGCCSDGSCGSGQCGNGKCGGLFGAGDPSLCPCGPGDSVYDFTPGPATAAVGYPYYTVKGPRDFLMKNPPSIGPTGAYGCR